MLRAKKKEFDEQLEQIRKSIEDFKRMIVEHLVEVFEEAKQALIETFLPVVMAKPPPDLVGQIPNGKPTKEQARRYLEIELDKIMPNPEGVVGEIALEQMIKDVTWEMLKDDEFQRKVSAAYPLLNFTEGPMTEYPAAPGKGGLPEF